MRRTVAGVGVGVLLLAGCSDSAGIALDEWVTEADAICAEFTAKVDAMEEPSSEDDLLTMMDSMGDMAKQQRDDLRALGTPEGEGAEQVEEAFKLLDRQVEVFEQVVTDADGDATALMEAMNDEELSAEMDGIEADLDELGSELGLKECGKDGESSDEESPSTTEAMTDDTMSDGSSSPPSDDVMIDRFIEGMTEDGTMTEEEATCVAEGLLEDFSLGDIVDMTSGGEPNDELMEAIVPLTLDCVDLSGE